MVENKLFHTVVGLGALNAPCTAVGDVYICPPGVVRVKRSDTPLPQIPDIYPGKPALLGVVFPRLAGVVYKSLSTYQHY